MKKVALITGISGQDGSYLAKFLIKKKRDPQRFFYFEQLKASQYS
jgi:hypothetical protein